MNQDQLLEQRIRGIVAVVTPDIDSIMVDVEDGVAYLEGIMPTEAERKALLAAIRHAPGLKRLISCVVTEHIFAGAKPHNDGPSYPLPAPVHYYSLS